jgi:hypothetical protein
MTPPTDGEWMSAEDALAFLRMPHDVAVAPRIYWSGKYNRAGIPSVIL